jgi:hypothetical protein
VLPTATFPAYSRVCSYTPPLAMIKYTCSRLCIAGVKLKHPIALPRVHTSNVNHVVLAGLSCRNYARHCSPSAPDSQSIAAATIQLEATKGKVKGWAALLTGRLTVLVVYISLLSGYMNVCV